jgi:hypothetical protein
VGDLQSASGRLRVGLRQLVDETARTSRAEHSGLLTSDELRGLMAGLVATEGPATGATKLSEWLQEHAAEVGRV